MSDFFWCMFSPFANAATFLKYVSPFYDIAKYRVINIASNFTKNNFIANILGFL